MPTTWFDRRVVLGALALATATSAQAAWEELPAPSTWVQPVASSEASLQEGVAVDDLGSLSPSRRAGPLAQPPILTRGLEQMSPEMGVWLIVRRVEAMRGRDVVMQFESNLGTLALLPEPVAQVPLPASAWFMVTGLLGLIGARLSSRRVASR